MNRRKFLKICKLLGISLSPPTVLSFCADDNSSGNNHNIGANFSGTVLIIGAGAAGMSAGYLLAQRGVNFLILESSPRYGGRMKQTTQFTDFPISLGAEWLHVGETTLREIVNDPNVPITIQTQEYNDQDIMAYFDGDTLTLERVGDFSDRTFIGSTWFDFFDTYIVPHIRTKIKFNTQIVLVDYQDDKVVLVDNHGSKYEADKTVVTAPLKILQDGDIQFIPSLPNAKLKAIDDALVWGGIKIFMEFTEKFYPTYLSFLDSQTNKGQRVYYDAAYAHNTTSNILGLFAVGEQAVQYQRRSGAALRDYILRELDAVFSGKPSRTFVKHIVQNWNDEPFIRSAYLADVAPRKISRTLSTSVDQKVFFAGEAYTQENDWGGVHNATRSARDAVFELLTQMV